MCKFTIIVISVILCESVLGRTFDQRQAGDLNVQVDLKNIKIFALTKGKEEYVDYDYAYDYSEMTIKPQNGTTTTIKPLNTTMQMNKHNTTAAAAELDSTTQIFEKNTSFSENMVTEDPMAFTVASIATVANGTLDKLNTTAASENNATSLTLSDCKKGLFRNKGNCELKLQNSSNILLKMLQKSKPNAGNRVRKS